MREKRSIDPLTTAATAAAAHIGSNLVYKLMKKVPRFSKWLVEKEGQLAADAVRGVLKGKKTFSTEFTSRFIYPESTIASEIASNLVRSFKGHKEGLEYLKDVVGPALEKAEDLTLKAVGKGLKEGLSRPNLPVKELTPAKEKAMVIAQGALSAGALLGAPGAAEIGAHTSLNILRRSLAKKYRKPIMRMNISEALGGADFPPIIIGREGFIPKKTPKVVRSFLTTVVSPGLYAEADALEYALKFIKKYWGVPESGFAVPIKIMQGKGGVSRDELLSFMKLFERATKNRMKGLSKKDAIVEAMSNLPESDIRRVSEFVRKSVEQFGQQAKEFFGALQLVPV